jgi:GT2 family glycosyltransferase
VIYDCAQDPEGAARTIASIMEAFGPDVRIWTQGIALDGANVLPISVGSSPTEALAAILSSAGNDTWLVPVRAGDVLAPWCGRALAYAGEHSQGCRIVYWDCDEATSGVRRDPWIKGGWDPLLYLARDSLSGACALHAAAVREAAALLGELEEKPIRDEPLDEETLAALAMEMVCTQPAPAHVPLILTHRGARQTHLVPFWPRLVARRWPDPVAVFESTVVSSFHRVVPPSPQSWPAVSIIIPTRDKVELLSACFDGLARLRYPGACEIIVVDNGTTEPEALRLMAMREAEGIIRVIRDDGPFNFAGLNNRAAEQATGDVLCLLNNDVEARDGDWLATMVRHAVRPDIGAVGALLLYPDGSVQHAGVAIGTGGAAGHLARGIMPDDPAYFAWHGVTRSVSAVTAACLVVRREAYLKVGGLDDEAFAVAFNDVDFCLRLRRQGMRNVFVAQSCLVHHESVSRGKDHAPANLARFTGELARFRERWGSEEYEDPHYSPLFSRSAEPCLLAF